jgi:hypothetical protein
MKSLFRDPKRSLFGIKHVLEMLKKPHKRKLARGVPALSSFFARIDRNELKKAFASVGITPQKTVRKPLVFFAGYGGRPAMLLKKAGFRVVFTDYLEEWAARAKRKGLPAIVEDAEKQATKPERVLAYVSYEPFPLEPFALAEMLKAEKGLLIIGQSEPKHPQAKDYQSRLGALAAKRNAKIETLTIRGARSAAGKSICIIHLYKKLLEKV